MSDLISLLSAELPRVFRWVGALARQLRRYDIALAGKHSGYASTDALTLADLSVQEILVAALRDMGPTVRQCRIEAEESTGDLGRFAKQGDWVLGIDPIDGTRGYRDRVGTEYAVMLHARTRETVHYSLVYLPEESAEGTWLEVRDGRIALGPDNASQQARAALDALPPVAADRPRERGRILVSGFLGHERERARAVSAAGLEGVLGSETPGSLYPIMASGYLGGALFHTPNVYDFPVCMHIARALGGDAVWVKDGRPVHFGELWLDERSNMLRLPGIVACAIDRRVMATLVDVARGWSEERYAGG
ncbi:MAG TPA: inositol monophosphatase family protein [Methylomirabilota bacterium]|jgi:3'(2'), 5'-bisphosphate nucleotidase|nr:inositol monophosphatase family protein [Methylomirabilota bacterium]